jgi:hypothetical protein
MEVAASLKLFGDELTFSRKKTSEIIDNRRHQRFRVKINSFVGG